jgi:hypothetical protein
MKPWLRATLWLVFWATLLVALVLGAFVAWLLTEVLPPGTEIVVDGDRFVLREFSQASHWLAALFGVLVASLVIVIAAPIVATFAIGVPLLFGTLGIAVALGVLGLVLWPVALLLRRLFKDKTKTTTIAS